MDVIIKTPSVAYLEFEDEELLALRKQMSYRNTSLQYALGKHLKNRWWKQRDFNEWDNKLQELKASINGCLLNWSDDGYWTRPGFIPYLEPDNNHILTNNQVVYPDFKPLPWKEKPAFDPYPYQIKAVRALLDAKHGCIELPTGCGKSFILLMLAKKMGLKIVVVTPGKSIFNELLTDFQRRLGESCVGGYGDGKKDITKPITIAIGKSLTMLKEGSEAEKFFKSKQVMLVDEAHTFAAKELENVTHGVLELAPYRMFVSATQTRGDGTEKLLQSIIGKKVMSMTLKEAIQNGYLSTLSFTILSVISPSNANRSDPMACKRTHLLYNEEVAKLYAQIANSSYAVKGESTLILVEELVQIQLLEKYLKVPYTYVHSASKAKAAEFGLKTVKLQDEVDRFNKGVVKVIIGTRCVSTGTNLYPTHNTCNWVGGGSEIITKQGTMGRSTRKLEISEYAKFHKVPKKEAKIFDVRIKNQPILDKQLEKRLGYYSESGGEIKHIG